MPPTITATDHPLEKLTGDAVVVAVGKGPDGLLPTPGAEAVDRLLGGRLLPALADLGARGAEDEVTRLPSFGQGPFPVVAVAGLGAPDAPGAYTPEAVRRAAGAASRALAGRRSVVSLLAAVGGAPDAERLHAVGEGALLGAYEFTAYKSDLRGRPPGAAERVHHRRPRRGRGRDGAAPGARRRRRRRAGPRPGQHPAERPLPRRARRPRRRRRREARACPRRSSTRTRWPPAATAASSPSAAARPASRACSASPTPGSGARKKIALVGKGITFDSGGISIKPAAKMEDMKSDMAGAAAVIATVCLVAQLRLPVEVTATVPIAENLPSGTAYRPADVVTFRNGKKAEITNTDAEGRVVLADAIARAAEDRPDVLLETSTLTGAQLVALGTRTAGVMGTDDLRDAVVAAGKRVGRGHVADAAARRAAHAAWTPPSPTS